MNRRHQLKVLALAAASAAIHAGTQVSAATVGIHFRYNSGGGAYVGAIINTASSVVFAGVPSSNWNNMEPIVFGEETGITSFTAQPLITPGATGISVDYSARNAYAPAGPVTDTNAGYFSYLDDGGAGYKVTIHGLSSFLSLGESYRITGLQATDALNSQFGDIYIYSGTDTSGTLLATLHMDNPLQFPDPVGTYGDTNQSPFLNADTITIVGEPRNGNERSTLAGLAIVTVPEPASLGLLIGGWGLLLGRRRRAIVAV